MEEIISTLVSPHVDLNGQPITRERRSGHPVCWFDEILGGKTEGEPEARGILFPDGLGHGEGTQPLTLLIAGPPGSGKTTLATELAYRWAKTPQKWPGDSRKRKAHTIYLTTESSYQPFVANAGKFGWQRTVFRRAGQGGPPDRDARILVFDRLNALRMTPPDETPGSSALAKWLTPDRLGKWAGATDVVIIDSLNVLPTLREQRALFERVTTAFLDPKAGTAWGTRLLILVLNTRRKSTTYAHWEYVADLAVLLRRRVVARYLTYTLEIVKARFQDNALGEHVLKVVPPPRTTNPYPETAQPPGIHLHPSVHWHMSPAGQFVPGSQAEARRLSVSDASWALELRAIVAPEREGRHFPRAATTLITGDRGTMKSHVGYHFLLDGALAYNERSLVIALRGEVESVREVLWSVAQVEYPSLAPKVGKAKLSRLIDVLPVRPGCITPEEFLERVLRMVDSDGAEKVARVLFVAQDRLGVRFPLCARQSLFLTTLMDMLRDRGAATVAIGVDEGQEGGDAQGLAANAELVVSARHVTLPRNAFDYVTSGWGARPGRTPLNQYDLPDLDKLCPVPPFAYPLSSGEPLVPAVHLRVVRIPGGRPSGQRGILGREPDGRLTLTPLPRWFPPPSPMIG